MIRLSRRHYLLAAGLTLAAVACQPAASPPSGAPPATSAPPVATQPSAQPQSTAAAKPSAAPSKPATVPKGKAVYGADPSTALGKADPGLAPIPGFLTSVWTIYDGLTWVGRDGKLLPGLAKSWRTLDDTTWEFVLGDWKFQNNRPVTADDVVQSFERYRDPANKLPAAAIFVSIDKITKVDDKTVRLTTKGPDATLGKLIGTALVMPMKEFQEQGEQFFAKPFGSGPFRLVSYDPRSGVSYTAMETDFVGPRGIPYIKDFEIRFIPEVATRIAGLQSGDLDLVLQIPSDSLQQLSREGYKPVRYDAFAAWSWRLDTFDGPTKDKRVRQAINFAVNKQAISEAIFGEGVTLDAQLLSPPVVGYNPELRPYPYDPTRAKQLLAEAGYPNGFETTLASANILGSTVYTQAVAANLEAVGIRPKIQMIEPPVWNQLMRGPVSALPPMFSFLADWASTFDAKDGWAQLSSSFTIENGRKWVNDEFDRLYQEARVSLDETKRRDLFRRAGAILREEAPVLFMWVHRNLGATRKDVTWDAGFFADQFITGLRKD